jgi:hypothetical protein
MGKIISFIKNNANSFWTMGIGLMRASERTRFKFKTNSDKALFILSLFLVSFLFSSGVTYIDIGRAATLSMLAPLAIWKLFGVLEDPISSLNSDAIKELRTPSVPDMPAVSVSAGLVPLEPSSEQSAAHHGLPLTAEAYAKSR